MTVHISIRSVAFTIALLGVGCAKSSGDGLGGAGQAGSQNGTGGVGAAGTPAGGGSGGATGGGSGKGASTGGSGTAGTSGGNDCAGLAIPALCKVCADNSCGTPMCSGGKFLGFVCPNDKDAGAAGGPVGVCNLACVQGKHCVANPTPTCVDDGDAAVGNLKWFPSCGFPVCQANDGKYDDPNIPNCTTEMEGQACSMQGQRCDGVLTCGATLICDTQAPRTCPVSRARYKQEISYLDEQEREQFHDQITQLRLATYRYKSAPEVPQLGFMIDDVEPSVAVSGDHVNMYAYLSMAVAAIQVQDQRIQALTRELAAVRTQLDASSSLRCENPAAARSATQAKPADPKY